MKVSVIIPTYNGAKKLPNILKALEKQSFKEFEGLVFVDGSTDDTIAFLKTYSSEFLHLQFFVQENRGRASVRNSGAEKATGELLIFFDDDMSPLPNCVQEHVTHHQTHTATLMSGAQIDDPKKAITPFQKYKCYLSNKWAGPLLQFKDKPLPLERLHLTAANFSIPKNIFHRLEGFDETLKDNEDLDLALRAYQKGFPVYYRHSAFAWHDDFPSCKSFIKRQKEYRVYHEYSRENKKEVFGGISRFSKEKYPFWKKMFYSFWKFNWWVTLTDKGFLGWIPKKIQYKIYGWIVFGQLIKANAK
jgi:glycosyltransferase involved in cell wall biosynthesis